jgi:hypothetical protein
MCYTPFALNASVVSRGSSGSTSENTRLQFPPYVFSVI